MAFGAVMALSACGGGADDAAKFVGPWTFQSGELAAMCGAGFPTPAPFPLAGLAVTFTKVSNSAIDLVAGDPKKCTVHFTVSGNKATVKSGQTCILPVGSFGEQTLGVSSWTLELSKDQLESVTTGSVLICTLSGSGVLVRGAPDAGVVTPTDGGKDVAGDANADAGADTAAETGGDAATEAGGDAATEAGGDAAAEAGGDAAAEAGGDAAAETASEAGSDATASDAQGG